MWATLGRRLNKDGPRDCLLGGTPTHLQIATAKFGKEYLKSCLIEGYKPNLDSEEYYLKVEFSYRRDVAKTEHRRDAIMMMASLVDYLHYSEILGEAPPLPDMMGEELSQHQIYGNELDMSDEPGVEAEGEYYDELMEDDEGGAEHDNQENRGGNRMYGLDGYGQEEDFVDELASIITPPTKRRKFQN
ncbi:hypothetical protein TWF481_001762 [Arthrobotrys musiformis]|uniref:HNH nuclease domain-containing protein n=1 Tax=Arthrobotrys musiformis TaxID=47236 RepID=A0AAV9VW79_9PEZI